MDSVTTNKYWEGAWKGVHTGTDIAKLIKFAMMGGGLLLGNRKMGHITIGQVQDLAGKVQFACMASFVLEELSSRNSSKWNSDKTQLGHTWDAGRIISLLAVTATWAHVQTNFMPKDWASFVMNATFVGYLGGSGCWLADEALKSSNDRKGWVLAAAVINLVYASSETLGFVKGNFLAARSAVGITSASFSLVNAWRPKPSTPNPGN